MVHVLCRREDDFQISKLMLHCVWLMLKAKAVLEGRACSWLPAPKPPAMSLSPCPIYHVLYLPSLAASIAIHWE